MLSPSCPICALNTKWQHIHTERQRERERGRDEQQRLLGVVFTTYYKVKHCLAFLLSLIILSISKNGFVAFPKALLHWLQAKLMPIAQNTTISPFAIFFIYIFFAFSCHIERLFRLLTKGNLVANENQWSPKSNSQHSLFAFFFLPIFTLLWLSLFCRCNIKLFVVLTAFDKRECLWYVCKSYQAIRMISNIQESNWLTQFMFNYPDLYHKNFMTVFLHGLMCCAPEWKTISHRHIPKQTDKWKRCRKKSTWQKC